MNLPYIYWLTQRDRPTPRRKFQNRRRLMEYDAELDGSEIVGISVKNPALGFPYEVEVEYRDDQGHLKTSGQIEVICTSETLFFDKKLHFRVFCDIQVL